MDSVQRYYEAQAKRFSALAERSPFPEIATQSRKMALDYERLAKRCSGFAKASPLPAGERPEDAGELPVS